MPAGHADFLNPCISDTLIMSKDQVSEDREAQCVWLSFLSQDIKTEQFTKSPKQKQSKHYWLRVVGAIAALRGTGLSRILKVSHHLPEKAHVLQGSCDMGAVCLYS